MKLKFKLESSRLTTGYFYKHRSVLLSTIKLPDDDGVERGYETCIFWIKKHDSEVLDNYDTVEQAIEGHCKYQEKYNLTPETFVL